MVENHDTGAESRPSERDSSILRDADDFDLLAAPGHLIRRWQQRAVEIFQQEVGSDGPTPRQFALLVTIQQNPGLSQTTLVKLTGVDRSTIADMIDRLTRRGWVRRRRILEDQRTNALYLTDQGSICVHTAVPAVDRAQSRILELIPAQDQARFLSNLTRILDEPQDDM